MVLGGHLLDGRMWFHESLGQSPRISVGKREGGSEMLEGGLFAPVVAMRDLLCGRVNCAHKAPNCTGISLQIRSPSLTKRCC